MRDVVTKTYDSESPGLYDPVLDHSRAEGSSTSVDEKPMMCLDARAQRILQAASIAYLMTPAFKARYVLPGHRDSEQGYDTSGSTHFHSLLNAQRSNSKRSDSEKESSATWGRS